MLEVIFIIFAGLSHVNTNAKSAKISMIPLPLGNSEYYIMLNLAEELLSRGHDVSLYVIIKAHVHRNSWYKGHQVTCVKYGFCFRGKSIYM